MSIQTSFFYCSNIRIQHVLPMESETTYRTKARPCGEPRGSAPNKRGSARDVAHHPGLHGSSVKRFDFELLFIREFLACYAYAFFHNLSSFEERA